MLRAVRMKSVSALLAATAMTFGAAPAMAQPTRFPGVSGNHPGDPIPERPDRAGSASENTTPNLILRASTDPRLDINPIIFGADPTGASDSLPAFNAAAATVPTGATVRIHVTAGTYKLSSTFLGNRRHAIVSLDPGVTFTGAEVPMYVARETTRTSNNETETIIGPSNGAFGYKTTYIQNNGGTSAIGTYFNYTNYNGIETNPHPQDIARENLAGWPNNVNASLWGAWDVNIGPMFSAADQTGGEGSAMVAREINVANYGPDTAGWTEFDATKSGRGYGVPQSWAGGVQLVPETWVPSGGYGGRLQFGYAVFSGIMNSRPTSSANPHVPTASAPYAARTYTPFLVGNNAVAPGGRGIYLGGNTEGIPADAGYSPLESRYAWASGIHLELATFADNAALNLATSHTINWGPTGSPTVKLGAFGTQLTVNGANVATTSGMRTVPTSGGSETYPDGTQDRFLDPATPIAAWTETLPATPVDGLVAHISCGQTITTLTVTANTGQMLRPATSGTGQSVATSCSATQSRQFRYHAAQTAWTEDY